MAAEAAASKRAANSMQSPLPDTIAHPPHPPPLTCALKSTCISPNLSACLPSCLPRRVPLALSPYCRARLLHAGEDRLAARRRRRLLSARFVEFRGAVEAALEARAADEARVARAGLRTWRAEFRREKGGVRHKRRVLRQWGDYTVSWRQEWPVQHRRRRLLLQICERYLLCGRALIYSASGPPTDSREPPGRWRMGLLVAARHRLAKGLLARTSIKGAVVRWRQAAAYQSEKRRAHLLSIARARRR